MTTSQRTRERREFITPPAPATERESSSLYMYCMRILFAYAISLAYLIHLTCACCCRCCCGCMLRVTNDYAECARRVRLVDVDDRARCDVVCRAVRPSRCCATTTKRVFVCASGASSHGNLISRLCEHVAPYRVTETVGGFVGF